MLAIFSNKVAQGPPELTSTSSASPSGELKSLELLQAFKQTHGTHVTVEMEGGNALSYSDAHLDKSRINAYPSQFAAVDDVFCIFRGCVDNMSVLKNMYGVTKNITEVCMIIETYKVLRDRAPYPADQVIQELGGSFSFILFDNKYKRVLVADDEVGKLPLFWGNCKDGALAFSDDAYLLKSACGLSIAPFPKGCYYSSIDQLRSFVHPSKALTPIPHVDSQGQVCGSGFKVDETKEVHYPMKHSGSALDWLPA